MTAQSMQIFGKEVDLRISKACNRWTGQTGVLYNKKIPTKLKTLIYRTAIRPTLLYGSETWPITGNLADKIGSCEMGMLLIYCLEISLEEHQTNEEVRKQAQVMPIQDLMRKRRMKTKRRTYGEPWRRK